MKATPERAQIAANGFCSPSPWRVSRFHPSKSGNSRQPGLWSSHEHRKFSGRFCDSKFMELKRI